MVNDMFMVVTCTASITTCSTGYLFQATVVIPVGHYCGRRGSAFSQVDASNFHLEGYNQKRSWKYLRSRPFLLPCRFPHTSPLVLPYYYHQAKTKKIIAQLLTAIATVATVDIASAYLVSSLYY